MDSRLYEAALVGSVSSLVTLLKEDGLILDRVAVEGETPLHIASLHGHVEFAKAILSRKPDLACILDSERSSALHLASAKGHVEIVKELLKINSSMCLVRDGEGRTPLHVAALRGQLGVVVHLVGAKKMATRVLTGRREPILHMCVNHDRFESVKVLLECVVDDEFVTMKDDDDNTILHMSAAKKHIPLTKSLLQNTKMREEVNALNVNGLTALDVLLQDRSKYSNRMKLEGILRRAGAKTANSIPLPNDSWTVRSPSIRKDKWKKHVDWLNDTRSTLMVVAVLIATVTFQAGLSPPGGVWLDETDDHNPGESIMANLYPDDYVLFTVFNVLGFVSSLSIILLLISGFPLKRRIFMWALMIITWIAVSSMMITYGQAFFTVSTNPILERVNKLEHTKYPIWVLGWFLLVGLLFTVHIVSLIIRCYRKIRIMTFREEPHPPSMDAGDADIESRINKY